MEFPCVILVQVRSTWRSSVKCHLPLCCFPLCIYWFKSIFVSNICSIFLLLTDLMILFCSFALLGGADM
jgi:hypothetical protein